MKQQPIGAPDSIVSHEDELLILVDDDDNEIGTLDKGSAHDGKGVLHRAFSIFLFDEHGRLMLQQRAGGKRLWPGFWSNTCCSHPRKGESLTLATERRLAEELGVAAPLEYVFRFSYQADFGDLGAEHEMCSVFLGRCSQRPQPNPHEIAALRFLSAEGLEAEMAATPDAFTPWFMLEWERLNADYGAILEPYLLPAPQET